MSVAPHIIIPAGKQEELLRQFNRMAPEVFRKLSCIPDEHVIPAQATDSIIVIECLTNGPRYTSYITAWVTDDLKYIVYYITLFLMKDEKIYFEKSFERMSHYNDYVSLLPAATQDYKEQMQYEALLDTYINYRNRHGS